MESELKFPRVSKDNFVTVVSVGTELPQSQTPLEPNLEDDSKSSGYVTVLTIGDSDEDSESPDIIEEVLVYRLPGDRLGFGLKFEGGTKANEFVKRLFIQSCAPDSPASRVQSSWGHLTEGDEVLEIDGIPVNTMTRIDCVRCLKDSNVVIKLLVQHFNTDCKQIEDAKTRPIEGLPQVISAEKKRVPPPPPPVPPRKIPKKSCKSKSTVHENPVPAARHVNADSNVKNMKFQSPRSSGRSSHSPDVPRRDRRFFDGSLGPPDAEVYVDLFSQESAQSLSESDDTGSSISTVVDRFGSFPTTTTSSLAGSLPSTPTSIQKQIDFSNLLNSYDDDDFYPIINKNITKQQNNIKNSDPVENNKSEEKSISVNEDGTPLQPPSCFQDAPLSYGNEDMRIESKSNMCEATTDNSYSISEKTRIKSFATEEKVYKKPPVPPRSRDLINNHKTNGVNGYKDFHDENMNISNLPRLVDFVPKTLSKDNLANHIEINKEFLENERRDGDYLKDDFYGDDDIDAGLDVYSNEIEVYSSKWSLSHLATIGEDEEEGTQELNVNRSTPNSTPIVIVENADFESIEASSGTDMRLDETFITNEGINGKMETLSSDSRQPPDGHEFPDYDDSSGEPAGDKFIRENYEELFDPRLKSAGKPYKSVETITSSQRNSSFNDYPVVPMEKKLFWKMNSISNSDLSSVNSTDPFDSGGEEVTLRQSSSALHTRSQSLIDMSTISKQKTDRWSSLIEQRRKGYSKLKGLVIPEHVAETVSTPAVNIPEIISHTIPTLLPDTKTNANDGVHSFHSNETEQVAVPLTLPPWSSPSTIPKYSPAFKRKSLQVYSHAKLQTPEEPQVAINKAPADSAKIKTRIDSDEFRLENLSDSPKSLESITSPTRSDCSFDYITNSLSKDKYNNKQEPKIFSNIQKLRKDTGKSEDESDNDSAVSSSPSSYISRCSPPPSPTRSCGVLDDDPNIRKKMETLQDANVQCRLLKPASVEAINRKNILASAKCRSGRDLKVGSPVIQRKYEEEDPALPVAEPETPSSEELLVLTSKPEQPIPEPRIIAKERKTIAMQESAIKVNGVNGTATKNEVYVSLKSSASIKEFPAQLRETKIPPKTTYNKPNSLLKNKSMSVTDIRKSFEKFGNTPPPFPQNVAITVAAKESPFQVNKVQEKTNKHITSLKKVEKMERLAKVETVESTSAPPNKQADQENKEQGSSAGCRRTVALCPDFLGGSIGITLAGGTDYETKEITIHKIRYGSVAYTSGNIKKGDRIISINGKDTEGLTHAESVELLKEPVLRFELVLEDGKEPVSSPQRKSFIYEVPESKHSAPAAQRSVTHVVKLTKDGAGLGFSIEGGKDSPQGDLPLLVKKVFQGGSAEKSGELCVGDEILAINDTNVTNLSRIETWSLMKKLPDGSVNIHIHR